MTVNELPNTHVKLKHNKIHNLISINKRVSVGKVMLVIIVTIWNVNIYIYIYIYKYDNLLSVKYI